jgi:hypothetical protein
MSKTLASALLALPLALAACGGAPDWPLEVSSNIKAQEIVWAGDPGLQERTESAISTAASVWGDPGLPTTGVSVTYVDQIIDCGGIRAIGCATGNSDGSWFLQIFASGAPCVEATTLPHEVGHIILGGDSHHTDPRWHDHAFWAEMAKQLHAKAPSEDAACSSFLQLNDALFAIDGD